MLCQVTALLLSPPLLQAPVWPFPCPRRGISLGNRRFPSSPTGDCSPPARPSASSGRFPPHRHVLFTTGNQRRHFTPGADDKPATKSAPNQRIKNGTNPPNARHHPGIWRPNWRMRRGALSTNIAKRQK